MKKRAAISHVIHPLLAERWSPRSFADRDVPPEAIRSLLEAARWAPSCVNEQPWRFVLAQRQTPEFERLLACLTESNQQWAAKAGTLLVTVAKARFDRTGKPNLHAWHDVGLAMAQLTVQATSMGLAVHQMAGIDRERARDLLRIPEGFEVVTGVAIGYPGSLDALADDLRAREIATRSRLGHEQFAFLGRFGDPMAFDEEDGPERVLSFWFGKVGDDGLASEEIQSRWWRKDPAFDEEIRQTFGREHAAILAGERESWLLSARGRLAYVIVLDQFSRNMFRDQPAMFASDARALEVAREAVELGMHRALPGDLRAFFYLPLMHSESIDDQELCVSLFQAFADELEGKARERISHNLRFAIAHRDIIAKWGRFPHRNAILQRTSSPDELAFLTQPGSAF